MTAIGLVFAVLLERVRWSVAFKTVVFMPMAISLFAAGVIWRVMDEKDPECRRGQRRDRAWSPTPSTRRALCPRRSHPASDLNGSPASGLRARAARPAGRHRAARPDRDPAEGVPERRGAGRAPPAAAGAITGVVWRDFKPGGGRPGVVEPGELGLPGVTVELREPGGGNDRQDEDATTTAASPSRASKPRPRSVAIGRETFEEPFEGVAWLGSKLITPAIMLAYIWVWAGFAMVVIGAGLAAIPRDLLEAARTDGATRDRYFAA